MADCFAYDSARDAVMGLDFLSVGSASPLSRSPDVIMRPNSAASATVRFDRSPSIVERSYPMDSAGPPIRNDRTIAPETAMVQAPEGWFYD